jgi:hypothetical protein
MAHDGPRAVIYDDNLEKYGMSAADVGRGIAASGVNIEMVYYGACLMNMLENLGELKSADVHYTMASAHTLMGIQGIYDRLMDVLDEDDPLPALMQKYCTQLVDNWNDYKDKTPDTEFQADVAFTDLTKLDPVFAAVKELAEELRAVYEANKAFFDEYKDTYPIDKNAPYFYDMDFPIRESNAQVIYLFADILDYARYLTESLPANTKLAELYGTLYSLLIDHDDILIGDQFITLPIETTYSLTLVGNKQWNDPAIPYYNGAYEALTFDIATGWSKWLQTQSGAFIGPQQH